VLEIKSFKELKIPLFGIDCRYGRMEPELPPGD
jgi:hypothetical protein